MQEETRDRDVLGKRELATRWGVSERTLDRLRESGVLPWVDLAGDRNSRPVVRFLLADVVAFESKFRKAINEKLKRS